MMTQPQPMLLSAEPPSAGQRRFALIVAGLLLGLFLVTLPFASIQLPPVQPFIPVVNTVLFLNDLITATLLYAQFSVVRSRALLALASGYLFTSLIIVPHGLTFPGAFSETGLLGAGLQTTVWLYIFWHLGLPPAVIAYALLKGTGSEAPTVRGPAREAIVTSVVAVTLLVLALTWLVTTGMEMMPTIMVDAMHAGNVWHFVFAPIILALSFTSITLLWLRRRSVLDLWLLVVVWAWLIETILLSMTAYRFSLVWYAGRFYGLLSASFVLLVLLSESTMLYARLMLSVMAQRREREARLLTIDAVAASMAHEIKQPLGAIVTNSGAGLRWLAKTPPDIEEARGTFQRISSDGHRASEAIESIRAMFRKDSQERASLDVNESVREAAALLRSELQARGIALRLELAPRLPTVHTYKGQLQQVVFNVMANAADAMSSVSDRARVLTVKSGAHDEGSVLVSVEDSGTGIDANDTERIFDAFFTTKPNGMGMGLSICRSIVESHGGRLWASPRKPYGAIFNVMLPIEESTS
jgi:signal transduction histidine kinase